MKRLISILSLTALLATASSSSAANVDTSDIFLNNFEVNDFVGVPVLAVGGGLAATFYAEVLGGVVSGPLFAIANVANSDVKFVGTDGIFNGNHGTIPGVAAFGNGDFQVRAWQGTPTDTFDTATIRGTSAVWTQATGKASTEPPGSSPEILQIPGVSIQLAVIPEPSTIALGVLGGLGLLLRRRK